MVDDKPRKWRWYHHGLVVVAVLAFVLLWNHVLRPSDRVANIVLAACAIVFVVSFGVIQMRRRRNHKA